MNQTISPQHPAVVLRSHYQALRGLLAIATIAIVGLSVAVAILATRDDTGSSRTALIERQSDALKLAVPGARLDHRGLSAQRLDGGPDEHTPLVSTPPSTIRYDGGPEEGTRGR